MEQTTVEQPNNTLSLTDIVSQMQHLIDELKTHQNKKPYYYIAKSDVWKFDNNVIATKPDLETCCVAGAGGWRVLELILAIMKIYPEIEYYKLQRLAESFEQTCSLM